MERERLGWLVLSPSSVNRDGRFERGQANPTCCACLTVPVPVPSQTLAIRTLASHTLSSNMVPVELREIDHHKQHH
jgi:hypothetical protein